jgi:hypothetical protein
MRIYKCAFYNCRPPVTTCRKGRTQRAGNDRLWWAWHKTNKKNSRPFAVVWYGSTPGPPVSECWRACTLYLLSWICYLGDKPHSPNLSDLAECVILCTSWLQSPGKVYCQTVNIWVTLVELRGPILSPQARHQLSIYCIKELFGRNSPHLASVNSSYKI